LPGRVKVPGKLKKEVGEDNFSPFVCSDLLV